MDRTALSWFNSFLKDWHQRVKWNDQLSDSDQINIGVFQGEGNSQLLFSLFINSIISYINNCTLRQFADDTCLSIVSKTDPTSINSAISKINNDLIGIEKFCDLFQLNINPKKSKAIIVSSKYRVNLISYKEMSPIKIQNETIEYVEYVKYLGNSFNRTFSASEHVDTFCKKI